MLVFTLLKTNTPNQKSGKWLGLLILLTLAIGVAQLVRENPDLNRLRNIEAKIDSGNRLSSDEQKEYCKLLQSVRGIYIENCEKKDFSSLWQGGRIISETNRKKGCKLDYLFPNRNLALNWGRQQLGHDTFKTYHSDGYLNGWENHQGDTVYWNHGDWITGLENSKFPHINYKIGNCKGHLYLRDKIVNTGLWDEFKENFNL